MTRFVLLLGTLLVLLSLSCAADNDDDDDNDSGDDTVPDDDASDDTGDDDAEPPDTRTPVECVDPLIGTGGQGFGVGQTQPGPHLPHGLVAVGPDTAYGSFAFPAVHCGGYYYPDTDVRMFSHLRLSGIGAPDLGAIGIMPADLRIGDTIDESMWKQPLRHDQEVARVGYYALGFPAAGIYVELTATERAAYHRYRFPETRDADVIFDLAHLGTKEDGVPESTIEIVPEAQEVSGYALVRGGLTGRSGGLPVYFAARFSKPFASYGTFQDGVTHPGEWTGSGAHLGGWVTFRTSAGEVVDVKVGISTIDVAQARTNLEIEIPDWDFDGVKARAVAAWAAELDRVRTTGGTPDQRTIFYTAIYHALAHPTNLTEYGRYVGFDKQVHDAAGFTYYTDFSLWDTFRTVHPLLDLIARERERDLLVSLLRMYIEGGAFPRWPAGLGDSGSMVGTATDNVFAGSYLKGITDFDVEKAYEGLRAHATGHTPYGDRGGIEDYIGLGYVSVDSQSGSVSKTEEYAYNDHALYRLADVLGKADDARMFRERSHNTRNLYNPATGFVQGRRADGSWIPFSPLWWGDEFVEGNAWQYRFYAPHDVPGLAALMGGPVAFAAALEELFTRSTSAPDTLLPDLYYWHGNEPDIQYPYLFDLVGRPDLAQRWSRWVFDTKYDTTPAGIDGNDDCGTLSAWYVLAALGIFPLSGDDLYFVGSPVFDSVEFDMDGNTLRIVAENAGVGNLYVQSLTLNGEPLTLPWLRHAQIAGGGELRFVMGPTPSDWGMGAVPTE